MGLRVTDEQELTGIDQTIHAETAYEFAGFGTAGSGTLTAGAVLAYSFIVTYVLALILKATMGLRISEEDEVTGIDQTTHAETAYEFGGIGAGSGITTRPLPPGVPVRAGSTSTGGSTV